MKQIRLLILIIVPLITGCQNNRSNVDLASINLDEVSLYPEVMDEKPELPSPGITPEGRELVLVKFNNGQWAYVDVTVENGDPRNYRDGTHGKGAQLQADGDDFPTFARTGVHSDRELRNTLTITGRSVSQITVDGRPWGSSGVGFMADDETIMSVIWGDNKTVKKLGLTHPDVARPWFHIWNITWEMEQVEAGLIGERWLEFTELHYHGKILSIRIEGSRGWQESIFNDELLGTGHTDAQRSLDPEDETWLQEHYRHLSNDQMNELKEQLTYEHSGELVIYYINRYGFYEGHSDFRIDPLKTAYLFGLRTIEEIHKAADGDLYHYFTTHFTENPE